eukprot:gene8080-20251_t
MHVVREENGLGSTWKIGRKTCQVGMLAIEFKGLAAIHAVASVRPTVLGAQTPVSIGYNYAWHDRWKRSLATCYKEKTQGPAQAVAKQLGDFRKVEVFQSRLVMKSGFMQAETKLDEKKKK